MLRWTAVWAAALAASLGCGQSTVSAPPTPSPATAEPGATTGTDAVAQPVGQPVPIPAPAEPDSFGRGLEALCRISREVKADATIDARDKPVRIADRFRAESPDPEVPRFLGRLAGMAPSERMPALQSEAARHGLPGWSCPELGE